MVKQKDPLGPGDINVVPMSWQQALVGLLLALTKLAENANRSIDEDRAKGGK